MHHSIEKVQSPSFPFLALATARETLVRNLEVREDYGFTILIIFAESNRENWIEQNEMNLGHQLNSLGAYSVS